MRVACYVICEVQGRDFSSLGMQSSNNVGAAAWLVGCLPQGLFWVDRPLWIILSSFGLYLFRLNAGILVCRSCDGQGNTPAVHSVLSIFSAPCDELWGQNPVDRTLREQKKSWSTDAVLPFVVLISACFLPQPRDMEQILVPLKQQEVSHRQIR